jgi:hypothetical protein
MSRDLRCVVDNQVKTWKKDGVLHREDGPAVVRIVAGKEVEEYWLEGCLISEGMLVLYHMLTPEIDSLLKTRKLVRLDAARLK